MQRAAITMFLVLVQAVFFRCPAGAGTAVEDCEKNILQTSIS